MMVDTDGRFFDAARFELAKARKKFPGEEGTLTDAEWLAVLVEEVGEAARAMQDETDERLREELVQVAAMAARWAGSIPLGRSRPPWSGR
jgi:NTP pyrophosphatase (non-canonical NTP hydrolase)